MTILHEIYGKQLQRFSSPLSNFFRSGISFQNGRLSNRKSDQSIFKFSKLQKKDSKDKSKINTVKHTECSVIYEDENKKKKLELKKGLLSEEY